MVVSSPITFLKLPRRAGTSMASIARGKFIMMISTAWNVTISYSMPPILSRHIPGVKFAGLIHPGLIGTAPR